jgi:hypothetical protein
MDKSFFVFLFFGKDKKKKRNYWIFTTGIFWAKLIFFPEIRGASVTMGI